MTKKQHYMTYAERLKLEALHNSAKWSVARIAATLGFCRQTIYNELKLGAYQHTVEWWEETRYSADKAQQLHAYAQTGKGRPEKIGHDHKTAAFLEEMILKERYSPAAALAAAKEAGCSTIISIGTLYNYIYKGMFQNITRKDLWEASKRKRKKAPEEKRIAHPALPSIEDRPKEINERTERGHWEMDLIIGCKGSRAVLLTLTERMTRKEINRKLPDRKALTIRQALNKIEDQTPDFKLQFKTITTDNGSEFLQYEEIKKSTSGKGSRFEVYYCHSFAAWEKGSNENHNRMIRRFFPKGTDFTEIDEARIAAVQDWMNNYPRKILNWKTPNQMCNTIAAAAAS